MCVQSENYVKWSYSVFVVFQQEKFINAISSELFDS